MKTVVLRIVFNDEKALTRTVSEEAAKKFVECFLGVGHGVFGETTPSDGTPSPWAFRMEDVRWMDVLPIEAVQQAPQSQNPQFGKLGPGTSGLW